MVTESPPCRSSRFSTRKQEYQECQTFLFPSYLQSWKNLSKVIGGHEQGYFRWMKKRWMVNGHACTPIQSRPGGRKDRCDEISSSRWGFPWRPDLPRFSPLGQGHPSRTLSHNRCAFTLLLEKSSIFLLPFFTGRELLEMETFFLKGRWWWWNVWKELSTMIFTSATKQNMGIVLPDSLALPKQLSAFVQLSFSLPPSFSPPLLI